jgi:predicted ATPase
MAGWQSEEHFSDGTLRLLGLLWAFLDGDAPLLLEEPELSLHPAVVRYIPSMMARAGGKKTRQILISTHSSELLSDEGISPEEILLLLPSQEATLVRRATEDDSVETLLHEGLSAGEVVLSATAPESTNQLALFGP